MIKKVLILILTGISYFAFGQEMLKYEKKTYKAPDGKMYINKALPIYLWMSTSKSESSDKQLLTSEETPAYANPMYLDTEGYNTVRSPSCVDTVTKKVVYPITDIIFEIYADSRSPRTTIKYNGAKTYKKDGKIYVGGEAKIELSARDEMSGVEQVLYSIDGSPYKKYEKAIDINEEKEYQLKYYSVDNVGNVEELTELIIVFDKSAPVSKLNIEGDKHNDVLSGKTKISIETSDKGIGVKNVYYKIDDNTEKIYKYSLNTTYLSQGEHTITYRSTDNVNNEEKTNSYTFYIDKTPPTIIEEVEGKSFFANGKEYSSGRARLKLTALDNKAGVKEIKYSINGDDYKTYEKPVMLSVASGNLVVKSYAVDNVNNSSESQTANQSASIPYIDLSGPKLTHGFNGPVFTSRDTIFISNKTKIALKARDAESGIHRIDYQIDNGTLETFSEPFTIAGEGVHEIKYTGYDNVDNSNSASLVVKIDTSGPVITHQFSTASVEENTFPSHVILFLSATDNVVGLEKIVYDINGTGQKNYISPIDNFSKGEKTIHVKAYDKLNNKSENDIKFQVK